MANECPAYPEQPCRVNLDLMPEGSTFWTGTAFWMYVLTAVALGVFVYGFVRMVRVWRMGQPWKPGDWRTGLKRLVRGVATHRKMMQDRRPGTLHAWVFWGFLVLFIGTTIVAIDADIFEHLLESKLLFGPGYLVFEAALDLFGLFFILGTWLLFWRRYRDRPPQLHRTQYGEAPGFLRRLDGDMLALLMLLAIGVTGFLLEALRLSHQQKVDGIGYAHWSFVGSSLSLLVRTWEPEQLRAVYVPLWWTHFALWSAVLAVLPWTKLKHIVTGSLNLFFHDPSRQSRPELPTPFNLQQVIESGSTDIPPVGYKTIRDLTWKDRLSLDACMNCGRCEAQCPATAAGRYLSPRKLIQDLKNEMWRDATVGRKEEPKLLANADGIGAAIDETMLWSCTTCRACVTACPVDIEHIDLIVNMRRSLVNESKLDEHQQKLLVNITNAGNPYGFPASDRDAWKSGLPPGVVVNTAAEVVARGESIDVLWWVGCSGSFDPRNQQVTRSIATILNAAGVKFAILGPEERCTADPARRLGEEGRFQQSVIENLAVLNQYKPAKMLAQCPHCFNALAREYPHFGSSFEVVHHSEFIEGLLKEGRLKLKQGRELKVTYHDSCYLMRHNGIGAAPRNVVKAANNGLPVLEMAQSGREGLCCGAGGANMWYEVKPEKERINVIRARQATATGADTVATACPFCLTMMNDGLNLTGQEGKVQARDLAEIVADNLDWTPPAPAEPAVVEATASGGGGGWSG
ncbi:MAG TPA: (Fe-S)-binding protein [Candidatus Thermoplasmatota archaeon]|nr:(Fe-S)-binding protein [Candidatus Thermoplasmatota archaeon]